MTQIERIRTDLADRGRGAVPGPARMAAARDERAPHHSILFETPEDRAATAAATMPAFFRDLNCGQIVDALTAGREEYDLKPFFYMRLQRVGAITFRHEVMQDLEDAAFLDRIRAFAADMHRMREALQQSQKLYYKEQKQAWFLDVTDLYCASVARLADDLRSAKLRSRGFLSLRGFVGAYTASAPFTALAAQIRDLKDRLAAIDYCVLIKGDSFLVRHYAAEEDYSVDVLETFDRFKQGGVKDYRVKFSDWPDMNHIEAKILEFVARLNPQLFSDLDAFCRDHAGFLDDTIAAFDREVQFYLAYLEYTAPLKRAGLQFCYPRVSDLSKEVANDNGFDLALAHKLVHQQAPVVSNDFYLKGKERILVVSGPNQGGKTTFARTFGQLHYLAGIGCPVPGSAAQIFLCDEILTHFEREEKIENLRGKLQDDLVRIHEILERATPRSVVIMNEIFTSTTLQDEIFLSEKVMQEIVKRDLLCVWVTFVEELASFSEKTVSMVSTVVPDNPAQRTFKVVRRPADGRAYAMAIAEKYRLTYERIKERVKS
jgi:DNA mismatch repair protein MutS